MWARAMNALRKHTPACVPTVPACLPACRPACVPACLHVPACPPASLRPSSSQTPCAFQFAVGMANRRVNFYVNTRPYLQLFLRTVAQWYDVVVFTASVQDYADAVINSIDPMGVVKARCVRNSSGGRQHHQPAAPPAQLCSSRLPTAARRQHQAVDSML